MISEVDIRDMQPSERVEAVNHVGWEVQWLSHMGWQKCSIIFTSKTQAIEYLMAVKKMWPRLEHRVYEVVSNKQLAALFKPKGA